MNNLLTQLDLIRFDFMLLNKRNYARIFYLLFLFGPPFTRFFSTFETKLFFFLTEIFLTI
jgi:hypothetical protein